MSDEDIAREAEAFAAELPMLMLKRKMEYVRAYPDEFSEETKMTLQFLIDHPEEAARRIHEAGRLADEKLSDAEVRVLLNGGSAWENPEKKFDSLEKNEKGGVKDDGGKPWMRLLQFDVLSKAEKLLIEKGPIFDFIRSYAKFHEEHTASSAIELLAATIVSMRNSDNEAYGSIWKAYWDIAKILTLGAKKYSPDNWKNVEPDRYEDALLRHYAEYMCGEVDDPESKMTHWAHIGCNAMFLASLYKDKK
jgi:hypothetical protein